MIDSHAHIYEPEFADIPGVVQLSRDAGIEAIVVVPENIIQARQVLHWAKIHRILHPSAGLHPVQVGPNDSQPYRAPTDHEVDELYSFVREHFASLCCLGEVGLDYSPHVLGKYPEEIKKAQKRAFTRQIQIAKLYDLPLNVHSRSAGHHAIDALIQQGAPKALLHAFDGKAVYAKKAVEAGYMLSIPPCVVRSPLTQKWIKQVSIDSLLLESDSPALAPVKGTINTPANCRISCSEIARLKDMSLEDVVRILVERS
jgi:TatD DNase family protein